MIFKSLFLCATLFLRSKRHKAYIDSCFADLYVLND